MQKQLQSLFPSWVIFVLISLIILPTLKTPLLFDDFIHQAKAKGNLLLYKEKLIDSPEALSFSDYLQRYFVIIDPKKVNQLKKYGNLPWWSHNNLQIINFRPIAAITHWVDYSLWPNQTWLMHLQSSIWFFLLLAAMACWFKQLKLSNSVIIATMVLFCINPNTLRTLSWLANRNIIISAFFSILCIYSYPNDKKQSIFYFIGALLSSEIAVTALLWIIATSKKDAWQHIVIFICWMLLRFYLGFHHLASGTYLDLSDILNNPLHLLEQIGKNPPLFFTINLLGLSELSNFSPQFIFSILWPLGWVLFIILSYVQPKHRYLLILSLLSALPLCLITHYDGRVVLFLSIAITPLITSVIFSHAKTKIHSIMAYFLIGTQIIIPGISWSIGTFGVYQALSNHINFHDPFSTLQTESATSPILLLNPPSPFHLFYYPYQQAALRQHLPKQIIQIYPGYYDFKISRTKSNILHVEVLNRIKMKNKIHIIYNLQSLANLFNQSSMPFYNNQKIVQKNFTVHIISVDKNNQPKVMDFIFDKKLELQTISWQAWNWQKFQFETRAPLQIGQTSFFSATTSRPAYLQ